MHWHWDTMLTVYSIRGLLMAGFGTTGDTSSVRIRSLTWPWPPHG